MSSRVTVCATLWRGSFLARTLSLSTSTTASHALPLFFAFDWLLRACTFTQTENER